MHNNYPLLTTRDINQAAIAKGSGYQTEPYPQAVRAVREAL